MGYSNNRLPLRGRRDWGLRPGNTLERVRHDIYSKAPNVILEPTGESQGKRMKKQCLVMVESLGKIVCLQPQSRNHNLPKKTASSGQ